MSQTTEPNFTDFSKPAYDLGVLKTISVTAAANGVGRAAHNMGRLPNIAIPINVSSTDGSIAHSALNVASTTNGLGYDETYVYVIATASSYVTKVAVG